MVGTRVPVGVAVSTYVLVGVAACVEAGHEVCSGHKNDQYEVGVGAV